jgi:diguanylate cyclase (GGDEF)-like protein
MQDMIRAVEGPLLTWDEITALVEELRRAGVEMKESLLVQLLMTLIHQTRFDALTGLYNRRYLMECLAREVARAQRYGSAFSLLLLDLDHFKRINDTYGHLVGDTVLETVGAVLRDMLRATDLPGRYGGEEFGIVLPDTGLQEAHTLAERIRQRMAAQSFQTPEGLTFGITCSLGLAQWTARTSAVVTILEHADHALYQAKSAGRNRVMIFQERA